MEKELLAELLVEHLKFEITKLLEVDSLDFENITWEYENGKLEIELSDGEEQIIKTEENGEIYEDHSKEYNEISYFCKTSISKVFNSLLTEKIKVKYPIEEKVESIPYDGNDDSFERYLIEKTINIKVESTAEFLLSQPSFIGMKKVKEVLYFENNKELNEQYQALMLSLHLDDALAENTLQKRKIKI